jgi:hypothetical protein
MYRQDRCDQPAPNPHGRQQQRSEHDGIGGPEKRYGIRLQREDESDLDPYKIGGSERESGEECVPWVHFDGAKGEVRIRTTECRINDASECNHDPAEGPRSDVVAASGAAPDGIGWRMREPDVERGFAEALPRDGTACQR